MSKNSSSSILKSCKTARGGSAEPTSTNAAFAKLMAKKDGKRNLVRGGSAAQTSIAKDKTTAARVRGGHGHGGGHGGGGGGGGGHHEEHHEGWGGHARWGGGYGYGWRGGLYLGGGSYAACIVTCESNGGSPGACAAACGGIVF